MNSRILGLDEMIQFRPFNLPLSELRLEVVGPA